MKLTTKFFALITGLFVLASTMFAQTAVSAVTGGTAVNLLSTGGYIIDSITFTATTTNNTTVKFYDSSSTATNIVRAAYTSYSSYSTNFDSVFTNEAGILVTNTFVGRYTYPTSVSAVTNERPKLTTIVVPASGQRTKDTTIINARGLTLLSDYDGIVEVTYRSNN